MIYAILFLGFLLRLISLNQSLWLDEAIGALVVKKMSYWEILTKFPLTDNHPPLYYLILKFWTNIFGYSEISLRAPSVILGVATIYLVYRIAKHLDKKGIFAIFASLLIATSPLHIYYSQEARMYIPAAFFAALSLYLFLKEKWLPFSLALVVLVFTDYVPVFLLPVFWTAGIVFKKK